jgi:pimeloyl-ACP methyl ester carboxylesterase
MWSPVIPHFLANGYNIILFDQRGHGRSSIPFPPSHTISDLADDIVVILDRLQLQRIHAIIGVSQGGAAALSFAIRHPTRTSRIIACDTQAVSPASNGPAWDARIHLARTEGMPALAEATAKRWFSPKSAYHPDRGTKSQIVQNMIGSTDMTGFEAGARALQSYDLLETGLLHSKVPTLLIAGEQDGVIPDKMTDLGNDWTSQGGNVECAIIPDSGHLPMLDNPVLFQQVACAFLKTA